MMTLQWILQGQERPGQGEHGAFCSPLIAMFFFFCSMLDTVQAVAHLFCQPRDFGSLKDELDHELRGLHTAVEEVLLERPLSDLWSVLCLRRCGADGPGHGAGARAASSSCRAAWRRAPALCSAAKGNAVRMALHGQTCSTWELFQTTLDGKRVQGKT